MSLNVKAPKKKLIVLSVNYYDDDTFETYNAIIDSTLPVDEIDIAVKQAKMKHFTQKDVVKIARELGVITPSDEINLTPEDFVLMYLKLARLSNPAFCYNIVMVQKQHTCQV